MVLLIDKDFLFFKIYFFLKKENTVTEQCSVTVTVLLSQCSMKYSFKTQSHTILSVCNIFKSSLKLSYYE